MQNLKEIDSWLEKWQGIMLIFMRAVESLEICTMMDSLSPKYINT